MCGFAGIFGLLSQKEYLLKMMNSIRHRGPDDSGIFENKD